MPKLSPGDVLSYSAGSRQGGPYGFRVLSRGSGTLKDVLDRKWPQLFDGFGDRLSLVINAYPASLGRWDFGVSVDTYLSPSVGGRALELAHLEGMPVLLLGQPLFLAELLHRHLSSAEAGLPDTLVIGTGGYVMPQSLERALRELCAKKLERLQLFHGYGVAEVDAACLLAMQRNAEGQLIYAPRSAQVSVDLGANCELFLSLRDGSGNWVAERFATGDRGRQVDGGYVIWNDDRLHPNVSRVLESWTPADWRRRTGYLADDSNVRLQLRQGVEPITEQECEFYDFARRYGQSWLVKPDWSLARSEASTKGR
jgi:hypothetical protein